MGAPGTTPGPWVESGNSDWFPDRYEGSSEAVWTVLRSEVTDTDVAIVMEAASVYGGTPTLDANAAQIAASGELYDALDAVEKAMLRGGDGAVGDFGWSITDLNKARQAIRAALALARGEKVL